MTDADWPANDRPSRPELHARFAQLFAAGKTDVGNVIESPVSAAELDGIEEHLEAAFTAAYRQFLEHYGPVATPALARKLEESPWNARVPGFEGLEAVKGVLALNSGPWISTVPSHVSGLPEDRRDDVFRYLVVFLGERLCFARCGVPAVPAQKLRRLDRLSAHEVRTTYHSSWGLNSDRRSTGPFIPRTSVATQMVPKRTRRRQCETCSVPAAWTSR